MIDPVSVIFIACASGFMLSQRALRTWRTVTLLVAIAIVLLGARSVLPGIPGFLAQAAAVVAYLIALFFLQPLLAAPLPPSRRFEQDLKALVHPAEDDLTAWHAAEARNDTLEIERSLRRLEARATKILLGLEQLHPPGHAWAEVLAAERRYYEAIRSYVRGDRSEASLLSRPGVDEVADLGTQVQRAWQAAIASE